MEAYRVETIVQTDGTLTVRDLPLQAGEAVEVIILVSHLVAEKQNKYPLRGTPYNYIKPLEPVGEEDWEALK